MSGLMLFTIVISIASTGACVVCAVVVWLRLKSNNEPIQQKPEPHGEVTNRAVMQAGDWANAAVNVVIGVLLGKAIDGMFQLSSTAFWPMVVILPVFVVAMLFVDSFLGRLFEKVLPSGIRPASKSQTARRTPLPRRLSLPTGLVIGVALARFGLDSRLLEWIS